MRATATPTQFDRHIVRLTEIFRGDGPATVTPFDGHRQSDRNTRKPRLSLRRRSADHPMVMFAIVAGAAFASMAFVPTTGPAFATFSAPVKLNEDVRTTARLARIPFNETDIVCRGQEWTNESDACMRAMAGESGFDGSRKVRKLASATAEHQRSRTSSDFIAARPPAQTGPLPSPRRQGPFLLVAPLDAVASAERRDLVVDGCQHAAHVKRAERLFQDLRAQMRGQRGDLGPRADHVPRHQHEALCQRWPCLDKLTKDRDAVRSRHAQIAEDDIGLVVP